MVTGDGFLELAGRGRNGALRWTAAMLVILTLWFGLTYAMGWVLAAGIRLGHGAGNPPPPVPGSLTGLGRLADFVLVNLSFLPLLLGLYVAARLVHRRPFRTLITAGERVDWALAFRAGALFLLALASLTALQAVLMPGAFRAGADPVRLLLFLPFALVLTPIQAATEELLMRGYAMQGLRRLTARPWAIVAGSSVLFAILHGANPEIGQAPVLAFLFYLGFGAVLALVTIRAGRLEPAIGIHAANNLFTVMVVNPATTALPSPSLFTYLMPVGGVDLVMLLVAGGIAWRLTPAGARGRGSS